MLFECDYRRRKIKLTTLRNIVTGVLLGSAIVISVSAPVLAARATTSFNYKYKKVNCELDVDWNWGKDDAYAVTYVKGGSGIYPLGAYCNALKKSTIIGGTSVTAFDEAETDTISYKADEFRSVHNIQNSYRAPQKSSKLSLID